MRTKFKRALFGYNRAQVDAHLERLTKQMEEERGQVDARIQAVAEENVQLAVELNVARTGYQDAAELMMAAQARVRELEERLAAERARVAKLEENLLELGGHTPQQLHQTIHELKERMNQLEMAAANAKDALGDMGQFTMLYEDGTRFDNIYFNPPEGITVDAEEQPHTARALMRKLYQIRHTEQAREE